ncbi:cytochrome b5 domain-containing protein RLF-like isoform X2 [Sesamum indicum]|uniref:Cytochrome b5 domain-containing protein RLF-like isoform X2 n=1 Tax=Sesamum indicum TaxID=4182 RepID=A0A6I9TZB6_SESIN|nr:cytochrome b5 domain-containing protein RLF-like isoform X2 [Sesamum indicum]
MANEDDFTFCSVGPPKVNIETRRVDDDDDVSGIHRDDGNGIADDRSSGSIRKMSASSQKQETIGSLSFNVNDASPRREVDQQSGQAAHEGATSSAKAPSEQKSPVRKSTPRVKVPFEKGYSQMDWLKLTRTHPDLAGVDMLMKGVGKDCTSLFNKYHAWVNAEFLLEKCLVGILDEGH